ncbi:MAG: glycoside hydrolase family 2, partial [Oscillospiraceae bacterium]|nr:glycoside hydrolase family 2 [Oscillospiraceae bacterium]
MSKMTLLCDNWEFSKNPIGTEYSEELKWERVDIPHDWLIYDTKNLYETSTGWYRRRLHVQKDTRTALRFEGVYMDSRVYVNGTLAGEWKYGYSTFEFDITEYLNDGENLIAVRADYRDPNTRWYAGAGIYRKVWLKQYNECHLVNDGVYISTSGGEVTITAETERPENVSVSELSIRRAIMDGEKVLAEKTSPCCAFDRSRIPAIVRREDCAYSVNTDTLLIPDPELWDIDDPKLYTCVCEVLRNGEVVDREETRFGFRTVEFTADNGFFLNGRHVKLHGCCEHHDLGAIGAAMNRAALARKLAMLREMGVNAIRTSHNMPAVELMELADETGMLILSEG